MTARLAAPLLALGLVTGCGHASSDAASANGDAAPANAAAAPASSASPPASDRAHEILTAEAKRAPTLITPADQQSRDVAVRRAAARALSRIGGDASRPGLLRALSDEDPEVVAWGAYGLGFSCKGHEKENVSALAAHAVALADAADAGAPSVLDPVAAIARAIGRCGSDESEPTLVAWLSGRRARAVAAAYALGDLAQKKEKLREETFAALLNLAAGSAAEPPVPEALYAVARAPHVPPSVVARVREVATARLAEPGPARFFAVRSLGQAGEGAGDDLARVVSTPGTFSPAERAEAARALHKLPLNGVRLLGEAVSKLVPSSDPVALTSLVSEDTGALVAALEVLADVAGAHDPKRHTQPLGASTEKALAELAAFPAPKDAPQSLRRRASWLRCLAAGALAGSDARDKALLACDLTDDVAKDQAPLPDGLPVGSIGARAVVAALVKAPLEGARRAAFLAYAEHGPLRAREAALEAFESHEELQGEADVLLHALQSKSAGVIGGAAEILGKKPQRATAAQDKRPAKRNKKHKKGKTDTEEELVAPSSEIVDKLLALLADPANSDDPELLDALIEATGALGAKAAKGRLTELCHSPYPTTREHTEKALGLLGEKTVCAAPPEGRPAVEELGHAMSGKVTVDLDTEAGAFSLELDADIAPLVVTRVVDLVKSGYYDGMIVHRVVPGFVTQFGAPEGDGSGGPPGKAALPCETSPIGFELGTIGVALSGRDTGSSQLFVMLARQPHLDGQYAWVGKSSGPWGAFVDGDRIRKASIKP